MTSVTSSIHRIGGEGPNVLLVHGFGADRYGWAANTPFLMPHATVWAVDLPGHGAASNDVGDGSLSVLTQSMANALGDINGPIVVVGHSLGGRIALQLLEENTAEISNVIALAPAGMGAEIDVDFLTQFPELTTAEEAQSLLLRLVARKRLIRPAMAEHVLNSLKSEGRRGALKTIAAQILQLKVAEIPQNAPVQIFWGEEDEIAKPPQNIDGSVSHFTLLPNIGHLAHVEAATAINSAILSAIQD